MPKSVNVILNSVNSVSGNTQEENYFIDWRTILKPNKKYYLHFVYMGGMNHFSLTKIPILSVNFNTNNYTTSINSTSQSGVLGVLMNSLITNTGAGDEIYLQSLDNTNLPIYLENMPQSNNLTVYIKDNSGNPYTDGLGGLPAEYVLILKFSEVEDEDD